MRWQDLDAQRTDPGLFPVPKSAFFLGCDFFPPSESVFIETNAKIKDTRTPWVLIDFFLTQWLDLVVILLSSQGN